MDKKDTSEEKTYKCENDSCGSESKGEAGNCCGKDRKEKCVNCGELKKESAGCGC